MKAAVWTAYGGAEVIELREVKTPEPAEGEILIRVRASTVTAGDVEMRSLTIPAWVRIPLRLYVGLVRPKRVVIQGQELAGDVEAAGSGAKRFTKGDAVIAATGFTLGAHAEYICIREDGMVAPKPEKLSYHDAACLPVAGVEALSLLRRGGIGPGQKVLINGAGGSIGTFAVQLARHFGAEVTAVDRGEKLAMLQSIGADHVVDFERDNFAGRGSVYDVIIDVVCRGSYRRSIQSLRRGGRYLLGNPNLTQMLRGLWTRILTGRRVLTAPTGDSIAILRELCEIVQANVVRPVVDRSFPLDEIVDAHRYAESGLKQGSVVVEIGTS